MKSGSSGSSGSSVLGISGSGGSSPFSDVNSNSFIWSGCKKGGQWKRPYTPGPLEALEALEAVS